MTNQQNSSRITKRRSKRVETTKESVREVKIGNKTRIIKQQQTSKTLTMTKVQDRQNGQENTATNHTTYLTSQVKTCKHSGNKKSEQSRLRTAKTTLTIIDRGGSGFFNAHEKFWQQETQGHREFLVQEVMYIVTSTVSYTIYLTTIQVCTVQPMTRPSWVLHKNAKEGFSELESNPDCCADWPQSTYVLRIRKFGYAIISGYANLTWETTRGAVEIDYASKRVTFFQKFGYANIPGYA